MRARVILLIAVHGFIALNVAFFACYIWLTPAQRMLDEARVAGATHAARPVVFNADSIMEAIGEADRVQNLAVSDAIVSYTLREVLPMAIALSPRRVLVGLGINDLRSGDELRVLAF